MFGSISAMSLAQHNQLDAMFAEAVTAGKTLDGVLVENPNSGYARFVLVIDDAPATGSEYDRVFEFDGTEIARGEESLTFFVEQLEDALAGLTAQSA